MHKDEEILEEVPYVYMGGTILTPEPKTRLCFRGSGIKELGKLIDDEDTLVFTEWSDYTEECKKVKYYSRWSIIRHKKQSENTK